MKSNCCSNSDIRTVRNKNKVVQISFNTNIEIDTTQIKIDRIVRNFCKLEKIELKFD